MIDSIPRPTIAPPRRRSAESPTLWMLLVAGSLLLHVALFLILRPFWMERAGGQGGEGAIAIELVDSNPATGQAALSPKAASLQSGTIAPSSIATAPPVPLPENDQEIQAPPRSTQPPPSTPPQAATPPATVPPVSPSVPSAPVPLQGKPKAETQPPQTVQPSPKSPPQPQPPKPLPPTPPAGPVTSKEGLPGVPVRSNEIGPESTQTDSDPIAPIVQPVAQGGGGMRMTIVSAPRAINVDRDIPDEPLKLVSPLDLPFPSIPLPPCIRRSSGKLTLVLVIDRDTGKPKAEQSDAGSVCDASVAKLIRENIQFQPASQAGSRVDGQVQIELQLTPL